MVQFSDADQRADRNHEFEKFMRSMQLAADEKRDHLRAQEVEAIKRVKYAGER